MASHCDGMATWTRTDLSGKPKLGHAPGGLNPASRDGDTGRLARYARARVNELNRIEAEVAKLIEQFPDTDPQDMPAHLMSAKDKELLAKLPLRPQWQALADQCDAGVTVLDSLYHQRQDGLF